jgi:hypothetical protein
MKDLGIKKFWSIDAGGSHASTKLRDQDIGARAESRAAGVGQI